MSHEPEPGPRQPVPPIYCHGLVKRYGELLAVDGLDLEVHAGECFGLLGPNGAGKTSTIEILEGLLPHDGGDVRILGLRWDLDGAALRQRLGVQLQETRLPERLTVAESIRLFGSFYRSGHTVEEMLERVQLGEKRDARVGKLSGGQRQRLAVACSLVGDPDLLFLDEPTTGLDPQSRRSLWEIVEDYRARGRTVLLTTHYMEEAERLCDRVAIMDHGRILAEGSPAELIASMGAEHVVEFSVATSPAPLPTLDGLPGVTHVQHAGATIRLRVTAVHAAVPALLASLAEHGLQLTALSTHHATLEDLFVGLTGRGLRDD